MEVIDIFTIPLFKKSLVIDNKKLLSYCLSLREEDSGRNVSNLGGWQSNDIVGPPHQLIDLLNCIKDFSSEVCNVLELHPVEVNNCWVNINGYKDTNWPHTHGDAILSGVYYVNTPKDCGHIEFQNLYSEIVPTQLQISNRNRFNSGNLCMPSIEGLLYIFPSWLRHGVHPNFNLYEERVSISFNLIHSK
jgi:uncharacterized protein (TIGR02466 family)